MRHLAVFIFVSQCGWALVPASSISVLAPHTRWAARLAETAAPEAHGPQPKLAERELVMHHAPPSHRAAANDCWDCHGLPADDACHGWETSPGLAGSNPTADIVAPVAPICSCTPSKPDLLPQRLRCLGRPRCCVRANSVGLARDHGTATRSHTSGHPSVSRSSMAFLLRPLTLPRGGTARSDSSGVIGSRIGNIHAL